MKLCRKNVDKFNSNAIISKKMSKIFKSKMKA